MNKLWKLVMVISCAALCQISIAQSHSSVIELNNQDSAVCKAQFLSVKDTHPVILIYGSNEPMLSPLILPTYEAVAKSFESKRTFFKYDIENANLNTSVECLGIKNLIFPVVMVVSTVFNREVSGPIRAHEGAKWDAKNQRVVSMSKDELIDLITLPSFISKTLSTAAYH